MAKLKSKRKNNRTAVLVLGPPRSGSSPISNVISELGVEFGDPARFLDTEIHKHNPIFFELVSLNDLNNEIIGSFGAEYVDGFLPDNKSFNKYLFSKFLPKITSLIDNEFGDASVIGLKDPRFCFTLPVWIYALTELGFALKFVFVCREVSAVINSNMSINNWSRPRNASIWLQSILAARYFLKDYEYIIANYDHIIKEPMKGITVLAEQLGLSNSKIKKASKVINADYKHFKSTGKTKFKYVDKIYEKLESNTLDPDEYLHFRELHLSSMSNSEHKITVLQSNLQSKIQAAERLSGEVEAVRGALAERDEAAERLSGEVAGLQTEVERVRSEKTDLNRAYSALKDANAALTDEIDRMMVEAERSSSLIKMQDEEITRLLLQEQTTTFRLARTMAFYVDRLAPRGTRRRALVALVVRAVGYLHRHGFAKFMQTVFRKLWSRVASAARSLFARRSLSALQTATDEDGRRDDSYWLPAALREPWPEKEAFGPALPLISVLLPVYRTPLPLLQAAIRSVKNQTYDRWELLAVVDEHEGPELQALIATEERADPRVRVVRIARNEGISAASNAGLAQVRGEFVALLDHDDELAPVGLEAMARKIVELPDVDFLYSDKDCISEDGCQHLRPLFKPEWSPEMMYSANYLTHLCLMRTSLCREIGGFTRDLDGAQDWDLFLRATEASKRVVRVPGVLYHWRISDRSTSTGLQAKPYARAAQMKTLQAHLRRRGLPAVIRFDESGKFHVKWLLPKDVRYAVFVDGDVAPGLLLGSLRTVCAWPDYGGADIHVILPHSKHIAVESQLDSMATALRKPLSVHAWSTADEKTLMIQRAVERSSSDILVFWSGHVFLAVDGACEDLLGWVACNAEVGFVSALVFHPDHTVAEAGLVLDAKRRATPLFRGAHVGEYGSFGGPLWYRNCRAASPWAVAMSRDTFDSCGGFDNALPYSAAFADLCLRIWDKGKRGLVTPHARVAVNKEAVFEPPPFDVTVTDDPYFHPAFASTGQPFAWQA